jgi:hypothetical protein
LPTATTVVSAQTKEVYTINADSTKLTGCDSNELIIENHTRDVPGFLYNTGKGRTAFKRPLTKISDTFYLVGTDTLKLRNPNAWVQGGNRFGKTGILGTLDNNHLDFYVNGFRQMRLDSLGNLLLVGSSTGDTYKLDVNGNARVLVLRAGGGLAVSAGDAYNITSIPNYTNGFGTGVDGSFIAFGSIAAVVGVNKQALGNIPQSSLIMGGASPNRYTTMVDYNKNPIFIAEGSGSAIINGGYNGIQAGGSTAITTNANAPNFAINGGRGTGSGTAGDIVFSTGNSQTSGTTIHTMTNRWWLKGGTGYLSNTSSPTSSVDVSNANGYSQFRMRTTYTPTSSSDTNGNTGDFSWDGNYFYIKTATGWKRAALTTF